MRGRLRFVAQCKQSVHLLHYLCIIIKTNDNNIILGDP